ncbi:hypothetical protein KVR01_011491 [Diaporthe batatas]|uniref:uncharacterized protein n=1 Tax=Diaporthe batatas TaxID=748121 RepID=UPI001D0442EB|nr:uncharacterized protein KVR01_011491 [Diaporthe batatas]KAG8159048.1 hypothetical protein KVR01_011491 [Diaporthe batatas]
MLSHRTLTSKHRFLQSIHTSRFPTRTHLPPRNDFASSFLARILVRSDRGTSRLQAPVANMDDFDIEMGDAVDVPMEEHEVADILVGDDQQEDGEVEEPVANGPTGDDSPTVQPNKIHIRGLEVLDETQLKQYVSANVGGKGADRIEWVDDSSANLVFNSESAAQDALKLLAAVDILDVTQLPPLEVLPAKPVAERPEVALQVRFAVESDRKVKGAAQRSRFYLFHPEWDPETEEGKRRREGRDRRYRDREDRGGYRRNGRGRYDDRNEEEPETFDVNLYDDDTGALARRVTPRGGRRRDSRSPSDPEDSDRRRPLNAGKELFPNRAGKELFPNKAGKELFPNKVGKELFPNHKPRDSLRSERGASSRDRSRSPARDERDAMMDDLAKDREVQRNREMAQSLKERISRPTSGARELFPNRASSGSKAQMDQVPSDLLADRVTDPSNGISIKGMAASQGISIKGAAGKKELFPEKLGGGNAGKELFAGKLEGRGRRRQKAEDLYF